jgi:tetratricopeptide (TPR) repeat protein
MTPTATDPLSSAFEHHQAGNRAAAEQLYRQVLEQNPQCAEAWHLLGALCLQSGRAAEAVELIGRAAQLQPANAEFFCHLGAAYSTLGEHDSAVACLRRAVPQAPQSAENHYNLGTALLAQGRAADAVASFNNAIAANPETAEAHYNLGNALRELERWPEAEASYREAIRIRPDYLKALVNLGNALRAQERLPDAVSALRSAVAIDPHHGAAQMNLGVTLRDLGQHDEAIECLRRAVELEPDMAEAHNNLGTVLQALARFDEAMACFEQSLRCDPELAEGHFPHSTQLLRRGDLAGGFAEFEWRWKCPGFREGRFDQPLWDGGALAGQRILLYAEQGLGDTLQFIRYARAAKKRGGVVIVECQDSLVRLLSACPGIDQLVAAGSPLPAFDVQAPLMSLPGILKLAMNNLWRGPYLFADDSLVDVWHGVLSQYPGFRVGICWRGNPKHLFDAQRSFDLTALAPLAVVGGVRLINLQKGPGAEQAASSSFEVITLNPALDEATGPFIDTAAVIKSLDLVVTADTAVAHLAGGLGVPVWIALSAHSDWRWMLDRDDSPWYPTARLFRQTQLDRWTDVFDRMAAELRPFVSRGR